MNEAEHNERRNMNFAQAYGSRARTEEISPEEQALHERNQARQVGVVRMNMKFDLAGERTIRDGTLIRSWAVLNAGNKDVIVQVHSNNSPRAFTTVITPGEQFIDANCSANYLILSSEGTKIELFHGPNTVSHWRFKSIEGVKPVAPDIDEDFNPVYHQHIAPVVPISEEEKSDAPADPHKFTVTGLNNTPAAATMQFFQRPLH